MRNFLIFIGLGLLASVAIALSGATQSGASEMPANRAQALSRLDQLCRAGSPVAHAVFPDRVSLNQNTGVVSYRLNIVYKRCSGGVDTRFFAVTGYPQETEDGTLAVCPNVGSYGRPAGGPTHDCTKYVGSPPDPWHIARINSNFYGRGVGQNSRQPSTSIKTIRFTGTATINNWASRSRTSGSATLGKHTAVCAHWQINGLASTTNNCQDLIITVNWTRGWSVGVAARRHSSTPANARPGQTIQWQHRARNSGPSNLSRAVPYGWTTAANSSGTPLGTMANKRSQSAGWTGWQTSSRTVTQNDVGKQVCRRTYAQPRSNTNNGPITSDPVCINVPYNYALVPSIDSNTVTPGQVIESGSTLNPRGIVTNNGPTKSHRDINWQMTQLVYESGASIPGGATNNNDPCRQFSGSKSCNDIAKGKRAGGFVGSHTSSTQTVVGTPDVKIDDLDAGSRVCFVTSVQRNSSSSTAWRHSAPVCLIVGKKPKTQVHGGSVMVGRSLTSGGDFNSAARVETSTSNSKNRTHGSWAEYGILAPSEVKWMASGSGLNGGHISGAQNQWSNLTFTHANGVGDECRYEYGCYVFGRTVMPNIEQAFPRSNATGSGIGDTTRPEQLAQSATGGRVVTNRASNLTVKIQKGELAKGRWAVFNTQPGTHVIIEGDLRYTDDELKNVKDIPQLVIIADNITIQSGVERVDAWLVARNALSTCHERNGYATQIGSRYNGNGANLSSKHCDKKLTVNGPMLANELYLRRTAGSASDKPGDPAEVINLRPDAYLWAQMNTGVRGIYQTTSLRELPPRY